MSENQNLTKSRWAVLFAACAINIMIGTGYAWSMFVSPLAEHFGEGSMATLSWAFTIANGIAPIPMIVGGFMMDSIGPKWSIIIGGVLFGGGVFLTGCSVSPLMVVICYGVLMGLGMGFVYGCTIGNSIKFFPDKAGLAGGLTTATYGLGSVILPLIIKNIVNADTVLNTLKVLGIIYFIVIIVGAFFIKKCPVGFTPEGWTPPAPKPGAKAPESKNWKQMLADPIFWVMMILMVCGALMGLMMISNCRGLITARGAEVTLAATAVTTLALFNAVGRVACGSISDKIGRVNTLTIMLVVGIIGFIVLILTATPMTFIVGVCFIGLAFGAFMGVYPGFCAEQFGPKNNGVNYGIMFIGFALAGTIGPQMLQNMGVPISYYFAIGLAVLGLIMSFVYRFMSKAK